MKALATAAGKHVARGALMALGGFTMATALWLGANRMGLYGGRTTLLVEKELIECRERVEDLQAALPR